MLTILPGTKICITTALPSTNEATDSIAIAITESLSASTATVTLPLSLPLTCTGSSTLDSTHFASSYTGHGATEAWP